jgi:hypothetical protein
VTTILEQVEKLCASGTCDGAELDTMGNAYVVGDKPLNGFARRALYQHIEANNLTNMPRIHWTATKSSGCRASQKEVRVTVCATAEARDALVRAEFEADNAAEKQALQMAVGMGSVARMISESRKPVVGHNCEYKYSTYVILVLVVCGVPSLTSFFSLFFFRSIRANFERSLSSSCESESCGDYPL